MNSCGKQQRCRVFRGLFPEVSLISCFSGQPAVHHIFLAIIGSGKPVAAASWMKILGA